VFTVNCVTPGTPGLPLTELGANEKNPAGGGAGHAGLPTGVALRFTVQKSLEPKKTMRNPNVAELPAGTGVGFCVVVNWRLTGLPSVNTATATLCDVKPVALSVNVTPRSWVWTS